MAKIELEDGTRYEVDDAFFDLPEEEQQAMLRQLTASNAAASQRSPDPKNAAVSPNYTNSPIQGLKTRAKEVGANVLDATNKLDTFLGERMLRGMSKAKAFGIDESDVEQFRERKAQHWTGRVARNLRADAENDIPYIPSTQLKDLKRNPLLLNKFAAERLIASAPDAALGAAAAYGSPIVATAGGYAILSEGSERIARERARRNGRTEPNAADYAVSIPAAGVNLVLAKVPGMKNLVRKLGGRPLNEPLSRTTIGAAGHRIGTTVAAESSTEAVQEGFEELASGLGTKEGTTPGQVAANSITGAIVGGYGAAFGSTAAEAKRGASAVIDNRTLGSEVTTKNKQRYLLAMKQANDLIDAKLADDVSVGVDGRKEANAARTAARDLAEDFKETVRGLSELKELADSKPLNEFADQIEGFDIDRFLELQREGDTDALAAFRGRESPLGRALNSTRILGETDLAKIDAMGLDPQSAEVLKQSLVTMNTLISSGTLKNAQRNTTLRRIMVTSGRGLGTSIMLGAAGGIGTTMGGLFGFGIGAPIGIGVGVGVATGLNFARNIILDRNTPHIRRDRKIIERVIQRKELHPDQVRSKLDDQKRSVQDEVLDMRKAEAEAVKLRIEADKLNKQRVKAQAELEAAQKNAEATARRVQNAADRQAKDLAKKAMRRADARLERAKNRKNAVNEDFMDVLKALGYSKDLQLDFAQRALEKGTVSDAGVLAIDRLKEAAKKAKMADELAQKSRMLKRHEYLEADPHGELAMENPMGGRPQFDDMVTLTLRKTVENLLGPQEAARVDTGPWMHKKLLNRLLRKGKVTAKQVELWNTNHEALLNRAYEGKNIIRDMQLELRDVLRENGMLEERQFRDLNFDNEQ